MKAFKGFRPQPPEEYKAGGLTNSGETPDYEGVIWSDGTVSVRWLTAFRSHVVWLDYETFYAVHGHPEYGTRIEWYEVQESPLHHAVQEFPVAEQAIEVPKCSMAGCNEPAWVWKSGNVQAFCVDHDLEVRAELDRNADE